MADLVIFFQNREICNHFNGEEGCQRYRCNNLHVCLTCHKEHPKTACPHIEKKRSSTKKEAVRMTHTQSAESSQVSTPINVNKLPELI